MATLGVSLGVSALKVGIADLIAHSARLKGAQTENAGIGPVISAFDNDLASIVSAYNNAQASAATCIAALQALDANIYNNLKGNTVTPAGRPIPGAAWSDATGAKGQCGKTCTAGCCVYYGNLGPALSLAAVAMGGQPIRLAQWSTNDPRYHAIAGGANIDVSEVFGSKYGLQDRPGYSISVVAPPPAAKVQQGLQSTIAALLGEPPTSAAPGVVSNLAASVPVSSGSLLSLGGVMPGYSNTGNPVSLGNFKASPTLVFVIVGVIFAVVLGALFGMRG